MFAFGGWPLFATYILIMSFGAVALFRAIKRSKEFDPFLVVITTIWTGYQLQSIISINQIGLAVWGWTLTGAAIAYERFTRPDNLELSSTMTKSWFKSNHDSKSVLFGTVFGILGLLLALPPFISDSKLRSAQVSRSLTSLESTMLPSYFNPQNSTKFVLNIQILEQSNLLELSHKYALQGVAWNPESYDLWRILYLIKNSTPEEKALALKNMKRLDPLNPDVTSN